MKEIKMLKQINTYFGNDYVRLFFLGAKIYHAIMSCNTDKTILFFAMIETNRLKNVVIFSIPS